ncbi:MAG: PEP-CTERM sorting domain-containing protein [Opitutaceae bacterium]|jgi:hypothetical protein|nr:PEP-CTERM sorting domain-containing protein [Opitutaceae bacterium]
MKITDQNIHIRLALTALASLVLAALPARAVIVASDTFSVTETRPAGSPLNGSQTEVGNLVWNANAQWQLAGETSDGFVTATVKNAQNSFALPFDFASCAQHGDVATISMDIKFSRNNDSTWYAFGFGSNTTGASITTTGVIYVQVNSRTGEWSIKNGAGGISGTFAGTLGSYNRNNFYTWSISYNEVERTVTSITLSLKGSEPVSVLSNYVIPESVTLGTVASAVLFGQFTSSDMSEQLDNFRLEVNPAIPEPRTTALIGGVCCLTLVVLRRKSR